MSLLDTVTGWFTSGKDADTYAANVAAQWDIIIANAETANPAAYKRAYDMLVQYYGPPAPTYAARLEAARAQYNRQQIEALQDGFVEGVKSAPGLITGGVSNFIGEIWKNIPAWVRYTGLAALAIWGISTLTRAGILGAKPSK